MNRYQHLTAAAVRDQLCARGFSARKAWSLARAELLTVTYPDGTETLTYNRLDADGDVARRVWAPLGNALTQARASVRANDHLDPGVPVFTARLSSFTARGDDVRSVLTVTAGGALTIEELSSDTDQDLQSEEGV